MGDWNGQERRKFVTTDILQMEKCIYRVLDKFKKEEKEKEEEAFRLHQAECPAFQSQKLIKWLVGLPIISTVIIVASHYFFKNHGIK